MMNGKGGEITKAGRWTCPGVSSWRRGARRLGRDERGFTAVEFGMVAAPFMMFLFGIINVGLMYFVTFTIENASESAARAIRTGQATSGAWTQSQFKTQVCNRVPAFVDCVNKLRVDVQVIADGAPPQPPTGVVSGGLMSDAQSSWPGSVPGSTIVMVTTFYKWDLAKLLPFLNLSSTSMSDHSRLIRAMVAFKTEPY